MSLNGLDTVEVKEAHDAAVAEAGGWYVTLGSANSPSSCATLALPLCPQSCDCHIGQSRSLIFGAGRILSQVTPQVHQSR